MNAEQELIKLSNYCLHHEYGIDTVWVGKVIEGIRTICASETAEKKLLRDAINQQLAQLRDWANDAERRCKAETAAKEAETERADRLEAARAMAEKDYKAACEWAEAAEERADRLTKEISDREELYAILRGVCEDAIDWIGTLSHDGIGGEALNHPLTVGMRQKMQRMYEHPLDNKLLKRSDQIEAAEERADRAERAQRWISVEEKMPDKNMQALVLRMVGDSTHVKLEWYTKGGYYDSGFYGGGEMDTNVTHWMPLPLSPIPSPAKPEEK